jgi:hypothetical protein
MNASFQAHPGEVTISAFLWALRRPRHRTRGKRRTYSQSGLEVEEARPYRPVFREPGGHALAKFEAENAESKDRSLGLGRDRECASPRLARAERCAPVRYCEEDADRGCRAHRKGVLRPLEQHGLKKLNPVGALRSQLARGDIRGVRPVRAERHCHRGRRDRLLDRVTRTAPGQDRVSSAEEPKPADAKVWRRVEGATR